MSNQTETTVIEGVEIRPGVWQFKYSAHLRMGGWSNCTLWAPISMPLRKEQIFND